VKAVTPPLEPIKDAASVVEGGARSGNSDVSMPSGGQMVADGARPMSGGVLAPVGRRVAEGDASSPGSDAPHSNSASSLVTGVGTESHSLRKVLLELQDVSVRYPYADGPSVHGVSLTVHEGECILFLGPSGCGKSTLALASANLIPSALEGDVKGRIWRDEELASPGAVAMVFQDPETQFCMLKVDDELAFGLENRQVARAEMESRMEGALRDAGLRVAPTSRHVNFSGGMKQKLAIASALVVDTKLLILDEPTANLDPLSTHMVFDTIARLRAQGHTMIVIEHKFDALLPIVDTVVLFTSAGAIHRIGSAREVVAEEWAWMVEEGIVSPWKSAPLGLVDGELHGSRSDEDHSVGNGVILAGVDGPLATGEKHALGDPSVDAEFDAPVAIGTEPPAAVRIRQASLRYGKNPPVWQDVSVAIPRGALVAVVGPNGSGKSSLLQVLTGLQEVTSGSVELYGRAMGKWKAKDRFRTVAYCFQNPEYQFVYERVGDELANHLVGENVPVDVLAALSEFGLASCAAQSPYSLSQGQKRRLSVASMLRQPHELYVLDEPTFGQDAKTQQVIMDKLVELRDSGKTVIMSTHDMDLVHRFATHVLVLAQGKMIFYGHPRDLTARPELMAQAHLLDDLMIGRHCPSVRGKGAEDGIKADEGTLEGSYWETPTPKRRTPAHRLNPGLHLTTVVATTVVSIFAATLPATLMLFALPIILMLGLAFMSPWKVVKRYSPFFVFYLLYTLSFVLFSSVPKGSPHMHILWWNLSWVGLHNGLVLAFRMLAVVGFGILVVSVTDITELIVSLSQNFRLQPRLAYGVLAGIRFAPMFQAEWRKLRQARTIRGKDAKWASLRPVTYALPLLAESIRMAERVAVAMEARGFTGPAALQWNGRTSYRNVPMRLYDLVYSIAVVLVSIVVVVLGNRL
jgi:energy-coupling factor transport system permease/ATP-binding protein